MDDFRARVLAICETGLACVTTIMTTAQAVVPASRESAPLSGGGPRPATGSPVPPPAPAGDDDEAAPTAATWRPDIEAFRALRAKNRQHLLADIIASKPNGATAATIAAAVTGLAEDDIRLKALEISKDLNRTAGVFFDKAALVWKRAQP